MNDNQLLHVIGIHIYTAEADGAYHNAVAAIADMLRQRNLGRKIAAVEGATAGAGWEGAQLRSDVRGSTAAMAEADYIPGVKDRLGSVSGMAAVGDGNTFAAAVADPNLHKTQPVDPTEELVEQLARKLCWEVGRDPDQLVTHHVLSEGGSPWGRFTCVPMGPGNGVMPLWHAYQETARAAIRLLKDLPPFSITKRMLKGVEVLVKIRDTAQGGTAFTVDGLQKIFKLCEEGLQG